MSFFFQKKVPSKHTEWTREQQILPHVEYNEDGTILLRNVRNLSYRDEADFIIQYQDRLLDPQKLSGIEMLVAPFWGLEIAHTFLLFHFTDDEPLLLSVEARRKNGQKFSLWALLPRQFMLMYIWGTEEDILRLRTHIWRINVEHLPLAITQEQIRSVFLRALTRTQQIEGKGEWYHMVTNNCTNNIITLFRGAGVKLPWFHWRYVLSSSISQLFRSRKLLLDKDEGKE